MYGIETKLQIQRIMSNSFTLTHIVKYLHRMTHLEYYIIFKKISCRPYSIQCQWSPTMLTTTTSGASDYINAVKRASIIIV